MKSKAIGWYVAAIVSCTLAAVIQVIAICASMYVGIRDGLWPCIILAVFFAGADTYYIKQLTKLTMELEAIEKEKEE